MSKNIYIKRIGIVKRTDLKRNFVKIFDEFSEKAKLINPEGELIYNICGGYVEILVELGDKLENHHEVNIENYIEGTENKKDDEQQ